MMLLVVLCGFILAPIAPSLIAAYGRRGALATALVPGAAFLWFMQHVPSMASGYGKKVSYPWAGHHDIVISFNLDGLGLLFALLISGIGTLIFIYAAAYLADHPRQGRFFAFLAMFMSSMLGLVLADNIIVFFIFWELTSITSFLLIAFDNEKAESRRAALQALLVTGGGGLLMLTGLIILSSETGLSTLSALNHLSPAARAAISYPLTTAAMLLILAGAFTKSAQWPFSFWLPNAMAAPTPVSAYLHSATMVKAGVYLCLRFNPLFAESALWPITLTVFGGLTFLIALFHAFGEADLKRVLAQTTVASLGLMIMLIGTGTISTLNAAIVYLFAHALFKASLFMVAGSVDHGAGSRDVNHLAGLAGSMPITAGAALIAALSMCGLPPFIGFIGKELMYTDPATALVTLILVAGNTMMFVLGGVIALRPFYRLPTIFTGDRSQSHKAHEGHWGLWIGAVITAAAGLVAGIYAHEVGEFLLAPAALAAAPATALTHSDSSYHGIMSLHLWGGFNRAFILSLVTIALGAVLLTVSDRKRAWVISQRPHALPDAAHERRIASLIQATRVIMATLQNGKLHHYMLICILISGLTILFMLALNAQDIGSISSDGIWSEIGSFDNGGLYPHEFLLMILIVAPMAAAIFLRQRLAAILAIGAGGLPIALLFLALGAPDLAFTQLMVELAALAVLMLVLTRLRIDTEDRRDGARILRDGLVSILFGTAMGTALYAATRAPFDRLLTDYFNTESVTKAHGHNIVNVILVDFRALDTLGEITVVLTAGIGILILLGQRSGLYSNAGRRGSTLQGQGKDS